jgi:fructose-1,6-bisphosphatase/inositol monophosphatase family enzyme
MEYYESPDARLKSDMSIVTEADQAIENYLTKRFNNPDAGVYLIGEETVDNKPQIYIEEAFKQIAWIVDPIDGTACYAHHIPIWGISIARTEKGKITDGGIYLPVTGELFITDGPDILHAARPGAAMTVNDLKPMSVSKHPPDARGMIAVTQAIVKRGSVTLTNPVQALACAVVPMTYMLLGRFMGYLGAVKLWDIAGCLAMIDRAGYSCKLESGRPIGTEVNGSIYNLEPDNPRRWFLKERMICASSQETADYVMGGLSLKAASS